MFLLMISGGYNGSPIILLS